MIQGLQAESCRERLEEREEQVKELLAEKEKLRTLVQGQAVRLKQRDEQLDKASQIRAELTRKVDSLKLVQPLLNKTKLALEEEKAAKSKLRRDLDDLKRTLQDVKERAARDHAAAIDKIYKENALREAAAHKELTRARDAMLRLQQEKDGAVKAYKESSAFEKEILKAKRQAYLEGLEMNVRTFNYYGVLDLELFKVKLQDAALMEAAPIAEYAQQWAHLSEGEGDDDSEKVDEEIIVEKGPNAPINEEVPFISEVIVLPSERPEAPSDRKAGEEVIDPMPLTVILPLPTPASERLHLPDVQQSPPA